MTKTILVTGAAGFVGFHASRKLIDAGFNVIGIDNINDYYTPKLKYARLEVLSKSVNFRFEKANISDPASLEKAVSGETVTHILHLAAQAGVRYSLENPRAYVDTNLVGHLNILELARHTSTLEHLIYASSSSVYGDREGGPFRETDIVRKPASLYAATKIGGEMLAQSYSALYGIPQTGLRFFTVYGPWGRPDMAYFIFAEKMSRGEPIQLFAPDEMRRDFTFIDDIANVLPVIVHTPPTDGHAIYNLGNSNPNTLMELVTAVENSFEIVAEKQILPKQMGDVSHTFADATSALRDFGFNAETSLQDGIDKFATWYKNTWMNESE